MLREVLTNIVARYYRAPEEDTETDMICLYVLLLKHEKAKEFSKVLSKIFHINLKMM